MIAMPSEMPELIIPGGLTSEQDPLRSALAVVLQKLQKSLEPQEATAFNYVPVVWAFREVLDLLSVVIATVAVAPLSMNDAPLPGWRRSLWRMEFADAAPGLLSWAVSYLPKRSRQNVLAEKMMNFLFEEGSKRTTGEPRPYTSLIGFSNPIRSNVSPWSQWRDNFFSCRDLQELKASAPSIVNYFPDLNELLVALDNLFLGWSIVSEQRGGVRRLVMKGDTAQELPQFLTVLECSLCQGQESLFSLVAPRKGERFLYREAVTGHLTTFPVEIAFRRRFFTGVPSSSRTAASMHSSLTNSLGGSLDKSGSFEALPAVTDTPEEVRKKLVEALTPAIYEAYHLPVLAVVAEAGHAMPIELLAAPGFGFRDGETVVARLNGILNVSEDGAVSAVLHKLREELPESRRSFCEQAARQLALWAESVVKETEEPGPISGLAVEGLARWAKSSADKQLGKRLASELGSIKELYDWLSEKALFGNAETRNLALQVSEDWIDLFEASGATAADKPVELRLFRCSVFRQIMDYSKARDELNKALALLPENGSQVIRARVLQERARVNFELELPGLSAEDAASSSKIWGKIADTGDAVALNNLAETTVLRSKALLSLGHRSQAISALQKVADRKANPRTDEESLVWVGLNLDLAELLLDQHGSPRLIRARFEDVLRFAKDLPENSRVREAKARALRGLVDEKDTETAILDLSEAQLLLEQLVDNEKRQDLRPIYADVLFQLAFFYERSGKVAEALGQAAKAIAVNEELATCSETFAYRSALAELWWLRSRLYEFTEDFCSSENSLEKSLVYYQGLIDDSQIRYIGDYAKVLAKRGALRLRRDDYEGAEADFLLSVEKWPGAHDLANAKLALAEVLFNIASINDHHKDYPAALENFSKALVIAEARKERGLKRQVLAKRVWLYVYSGAVKEAESDLTELLSVGSSPEDEARYALTRAVLRLRMGNVTQALEDFRVINESDAENDEAAIGRGLALIGVKAPTQAVSLFKKVLDKVELSDNIFELPSRVKAVLAHRGFAAVHQLMKAESECKQELQRVSEAWGDADFKAIEKLSEEELFEQVGIFWWEFAEALTAAGRCSEQSDDTAAAVRNLQMAWRISARPGIAAEASQQRLAIGNLLVRAYSSLGKDREAIKLTAQLLGEQPEKSTDNQEILAWLNYNGAKIMSDKFVEDDKAGRLNRSLDEQLAEAFKFSEAALGIYQALVKSSAHPAQRRQLALVNWVSGRLHHIEGDEEKAGQDYDSAIKLFKALREAADGSGLEWEISLVLLSRAVLYKVHDSVVDDLSEIHEILPTAKTPAGEDNWVREAFISHFADFIPEAMSISTTVCTMVCDIVALENWLPDEIQRFEKQLCQGLKPDVGRSAWEAFGKTAASFLKAKYSEGRRCGWDFIEKWLELALEGSKQGNIAAVTALEELVKLAEGQRDAAGWPLNYAVKAKQGLADFYASEGNTQRAVAFLTEARAFISSDADSDLCARTEADLDVKRAKLFMYSHQLEDAATAASRAELALDRLSDGQDASDLKKAISEIREGIVARGGVAKAPAVNKYGDALTKSGEVAAVKTESAAGNEAETAVGKTSEAAPPRPQLHEPVFSGRLAAKEPLLAPKSVLHSVQKSPTLTQQLASLNAAEKKNAEEKAARSGIEENKVAEAAEVANNAIDEPTSLDALLDDVNQTSPPRRGAAIMPDSQTDFSKELAVAAAPRPEKAVPPQMPVRQATEARPVNALPTRGAAIMPDANTDFSKELTEAVGHVTPTVKAAIHPLAEAPIVKAAAVKPTGLAGIKTVHKQAEGDIPEERLQRPAAAPEGKLQRPAAAPEVKLQRPAAAPEAKLQRPAAAPEAKLQRPAAAPEARLQRPAAAPEGKLQRPATAPEAKLQRPAAAPEARLQRPVATPKMEDLSLKPESALEGAVGLPNVQEGPTSAAAIPEEHNLPESAAGVEINPITGAPIAPDGPIRREVVRPQHPMDGSGLSGAAAKIVGMGGKRAGSLASGQRVAAKSASESAQTAEENHQSSNETEPARTLPKTPKVSLKGVVSEAQARALEQKAASQPPPPPPKVIPKKSLSAPQALLAKAGKASEASLPKRPSMTAAKPVTPPAAAQLPKSETAPAKLAPSSPSVPANPAAEEVVSVDSLANIAVSILGGSSGPVIAARPATRGGGLIVPKGAPKAPLQRPAVKTSTPLSIPAPRSSHSDEGAPAIASKPEVVSQPLPEAVAPLQPAGPDLGSTLISANQMAPAVMPKASGRSTSGELPAVKAMPRSESSLELEPPAAVAGPQASHRNPVHAEPVIEPLPTPAVPVIEPLPAPAVPVIEPLPTPAVPVIEPLPAPAAPVIEPLPAPAVPVIEPLSAPAVPVTEPLSAPAVPVTEPLPTPPQPDADSLQPAAELPVASPAIAAPSAPENADARRSGERLNAIPVSGTIDVRSMMKTMGSMVIERPQAPQPPVVEEQPQGYVPMHIVDADSALYEIDCAFVEIDSGNTDQAEQILLRVGDNLSVVGPEQTGTVAAALLEALVTCADAVSAAGNAIKAVSIAEFGCGVGRAFLAAHYDSAAWPWWGDIENQAGRMNEYAGNLDKAAEYYQHAYHLYMKLVDLGFGEESRVDAVRALQSRLFMLVQLGRFPEAMPEYAEAIDQGNLVVANGFPEQILVAELYKGRADLYLQQRFFDEAVVDYEWAQEFYARDTDISQVKHPMENATVRVGLAEALIMVGRYDDAYNYRLALQDFADYLQRRRRESDYEVVIGFVNFIDGLLQQYRQ